MCEYCEGEKVDNIANDSMYGESIFLQIDHNDCWYISVDADYCAGKIDSITIDYCPMCGRKLNDETNTTQP